ncbi:hypothetical protein GTCCBUS3UF5_15320 [Geobacillus thermoleovorans CCB_US3_UF5]|uniref:UPF0291 protein GK1331 n=3 Tax=Geobacillus thermoleovorans group TaxID=1505648 RepID=Y1331_GEOKA|nr:MULTISPECIES: DUF896 domain-containing protein [Geobacillus]Q5L0C0.1 RecName: Full=UPF0291 protein GK1331 [Geobacillus kaustophilus HTA426]AEV18845.1 hypothetical protein GTCCBUS3UF5_15320 [Geobacillus thermoleovorans CCB_US3_UF5]MCG6794736.1 DUF896 domain-containing protein [Geobacillus sp. YHL]ODA17358.1 hypothetical protein A5N86_00870 [Geobacillus thermoleovorans]OQP14529.1 hypothetical protein B1692_03195 [Geobacillus thermoleovorans]QDY73008.1 DUF896 domain-containing protein [Geobac
MLAKHKLARINELAKKAKTAGLSAEEAFEQAKLRREYIQAFRKAMTDMLHTVTVIDPSGNDVTPKKLKESQRRRFH